MTHRDREQSQALLTAAKETIFPYTERLSHLDLLYAMLSIQSAFIAYAQESGYEGLDAVTFDSTGFPVLRTLLGDINLAYQEFETSRRNRSTAVLPVLQGIANASSAEIKSASQKATATVAANRTLALAIGALKPEQRKYLAKSAKQQSLAFPLSTAPETPGVLVASSKQTDFNTISESPRVWLKYVTHANLTESDRGDFTLYIVPGKMGHIHALTPRQTKIESQDKISKHPSLGNVETYHPALLRALYALDSIATNPEIVAKFIYRLESANTLISDIGNFYQTTVLAGIALTEEEFDQKNAYFAECFDIIFNAVPDDTLKTSLQLAIAEALSPLSEEAKKLISTPIPGSTSLALTPTPPPVQTGLLGRLLRRGEPASEQTELGRTIDRLAAEEARRQQGKKN